MHSFIHSTSIHRVLTKPYTLPSDWKWKNSGIQSLCRYTWQMCRERQTNGQYNVIWQLLKWRWKESTMKHRRRNTMPNCERQMISCPKFYNPLIEFCLGSIQNQIFPKRIPASLHATGRAQSIIPLYQDHKHRWTLGREQRKQRWKIDIL